VQAVPTNLAITGVFTDPKTAVGQVTQGALVSGDQVTPSKVTTSQVALAQFGANAPLSLLVPEGMRAFAVYVNPTGAAGGLIRAGDYVDVIMSNPKAAAGGETFLTGGSACFVVQDVQVLSVGDNVKAAAGTDTSAIASSGTDAKATATTLAVTPEQAWWLAAGQTKIKDGGQVENQLWLSLRPFGERGQVANLPVCGVVPGQ
jgi:pilus assembly protein CpaB